MVRRKNNESDEQYRKRSTEARRASRKQQKEKERNHQKYLTKKTMKRSNDGTPIPETPVRRRRRRRRTDDPSSGISTPAPTPNRAPPGTPLLDMTNEQRKTAAYDHELNALKISTDLRKTLQANNKFLSENLMKTAEKEQQAIENIRRMFQEGKEARRRLNFDDDSEDDSEDEEEEDGKMPAKDAMDISDEESENQQPQGGLPPVASHPVPQVAASHRPSFRAASPVFSAPTAAAAAAAPQSGNPNSFRSGEHPVFNVNLTGKH